jgi:eukaryotic-like serine/threonine-protein kinase
VTAGVSFGDYRLIRRLGAGGMAEVFLAKRVGPRGFEKQLVIKRILPHLSASQQFTEMFLDEARLAALIDHPNLVHVSDFGEIGGSYYLAMEYVDGLTVNDLLRLLGTASPGVAARIASDVLEALHAIHTARSRDGEPLRLVHRDVSARNVMVSRDGAVKLLDFGIAVKAEEATSDAIGTRRYMAPEQLKGGPIDERSDLFSVGVLVFEMLTAEAPEGLEIVRPETIPIELWSPLSRALAADPSERWSSAREMQGAFELFLASRGLEGSRAYLGDIVQNLAPKRGPLERALTRFTRITNLSRIESSSEGELQKRSKVAMIAFASGCALVVITLVAILAYDPPPPITDPAPVVIVPGEPKEPPIVEIAPEPEPPPPPEVHEIEPKQRAKKTIVAGSGKLTIDTQPWTAVYLGGKKLGITPMEGVRVPSGTHEIELKNPDLGISRRIRVTIRANQTTRVRKTL